MTTVHTEQAATAPVLAADSPAETGMAPTAPDLSTLASGSAVPMSPLGGQPAAAGADVPPAFGCFDAIAVPGVADAGPSTTAAATVAGAPASRPHPGPAAAAGPPDAAAGTTITAPAWGLLAEPALLGRLPGVVQHPWRLGDHHGVSDTELDAARVGDLELRAASTRGQAHRLHGTVRQDAYCLGATRDQDFAVLAVGDGLGSAPLSHLGSRRVTTAVVDWLTRLDAGSLADWRSHVDQAVGAACADVRANTRHHREQDFSSTLVVAAVGSADQNGTRTAHLARVGDSTALHVVDGHLVDVFGGPEEAIRTGATACLPLHPHSVQVQVIELGPGQALVLATDGFHVPTAASTSSAYFGERWAEAPGVDELLVDLHFLARTYDDDRTVVGAWVPPRVEGATS